MKILITGVAGFIGYNFAQHLLNSNKKYKIVGIDNLNNYYSVKYKNLRLKNLKNYKNFKFYKLDISEYKKIKKLFNNHKINVIFNFAAQAGVRYSLKNPKTYNSYNINGFFNILEIAREKKINRIFYASSSSIYGDSKNFPLTENLNLNPKNIYALSKKVNEELAQLYSVLYGIKLTGLRFFTVYGEWGRPDMFIMKYIISSIQNKTFYLNNFGNHYRDFTYIKDVNKILNLLLNRSQKKNHEILNICSSNPIKITSIISNLNKLITKPKIKKLPLQMADVLKTHGSNLKMKKITNYKKFTNIKTGLLNVCNWVKKNKIKF